MVFWAASGYDLIRILMLRESIPDFDMDAHIEEYKKADKEGKTGTYLGRFMDAAIRQKSMVTARIMESGNRLCGVPIRK